MRPTKAQLDNIIRLVEILKSPTIPETVKLKAEAELQAIKDEVTAGQYGVAEDRIADVQALERIIKDPKSTAFDRTMALESINKIRNESSLVKSMRKSLIKEMRSGRSDNVKDITELVHSKGHKLKYEIDD